MNKPSLETISHIPYGIKSLLKWFIPILTIPLFLYGFLSLFPVEQRIETLLKSALSKDKKCPIHFNSFKTKLFFPGAILKDIIIPSSCFDAPKDLKIPQAEITWRGLSFKPFGLSFRANMDVLSSSLEARLIVGLKGQQINISDQEVDLSKLLVYLPIKLKMQGRVTLNSLAYIEKQKLSRIVIQATSNNLDFPPQDVRFPNINIPLNMPRIFAQNLNFHAQLVSDILDIREFTLGNNQSPLRAKVNKGSIKINKNNSNLSRLNIQSEVYLDPKDKTLSDIASFAFSQFDKKDNFYQIRIGGTVGSPKLK